jgi:hypothetical protein
MSTKMKTMLWAVVGLMCCGILNAADHAARRPVPGTFYSAQRKQPPLPFNPFPELPLVRLGNNQFIYDDREVNYELLQREAAMAEPEGGQMQPLNGGLGDCGGTELHICSITVAGDNVHLVLANAVPGEAYDVYFTPTLNPGFYWRLHFRGAVNQTEFDVAKPETPNGFYIVAAAKDTDEDGLTDGYEALVTHTTTTPAPVYDTYDVSDGNQDFDGDGLTNAEEFSLRTNPWRADSDGDGVSDGPNGGADFASDGIDNDGDGLVDEAGESNVAAGPDRFPFDYLAMGPIRGNRQVGAVNQQLQLPFVLYLTNPDGTPVANGQTVTFAATSPSGQNVSHLLSSTSDATGNNGFAGQAQTFLTLGGEAGTYRVTASWGGQVFEFTADSATAVSLKNVTARYEEFPGQVALDTAHFKAVIAGANPSVAHVLGIRLTSAANPAGIVCALHESAPGSGLYFGSVRTDTLSSDVADGGFAPAAFDPDPVVEWGRPDGVLEHCSADDVKNSAQSSYADSDAFDQWLANTSPAFIQRGKGRWSEDIPNGNVPPDGWPLTKAFVVAGGVDLFQTFALGLQLPSAIYNQADVLYFSGHGYHADNYFRLPNGEKLMPSDLPRFVGGKPGPWKKDLDIVIFAGCSLLDVSGDKSGSSRHPGKYWATTGPRYFLGYEWTAPLDSTGSPATIAQDWARGWDLVEGFGDPILPWENANRSEQKWNAAAINADVVPKTGWHFRHVFGQLYVWEAVPESQW